MMLLLTLTLVGSLSTVCSGEEGRRVVIDHGDRTHVYNVVPNENIYGSPLTVPCSTDPMTGWFRDGTCKTGPNDRGTHVVCAQMTNKFLEFPKSKGNDLSTPRSWGFPGLKPGDRWCLCAVRWLEAWRNGTAPPVVPQATHKKALRFYPIDKTLMESCSVANWIQNKFRTGFCQAPSK